MSARRDHYPAQLSGGQQQRVAVARALGGRPALLLADEPTGNLDSKNAEAVMALLEELHQEGATICMVTHDPRFAGHARRTIAALRRSDRRRMSRKGGGRDDDDMDEEMRLHVGAAHRAERGRAA